MRRLICLLVLALTTTASAKEVVAISVCGTDGCHSTRDKAALRQAMDVQPQAAPDHGGPFLRLRTTIGEPGIRQRFVQRSQWIPSQRLIRNADGPLVEFSLPYPATARMLARLSRGLKPFAASKLGPIQGESHAARVDSVVPAPSGSDRGGHGGGSGWGWSLLSIAPAVIAFWLYRRRRGRPSLA